MNGEEEAPIASRSLEFAFWLFSCALIAALPLAPAVLLALTVGQSQLDRESLTANGELLWSAAGVSSAAILRVAIDGRGRRGSRVIVSLISLLILISALLEISEVGQALMLKKTLVNVFEISGTIFLGGLVVSFFPMVWWVK